MSRGVGRRVGWDLVLLWLWCRPAVVAPIGPLVWEPPYAVGVALKSKRKKERKENCNHRTSFSPGRVNSNVKVSTPDLHSTMFGIKLV